MRGLSGKTVIVTGGGGGIGGATCQRFAAEGANVAVFDVDAAAAERTVAAITSEEGRRRRSPATLPIMRACNPQFQR